MAIRDMVPFGNRRRDELARRGDYENPFTRMHEELDRMFRDFFGDWPSPRSESFGEFELSPDIDVRETDKEVRLKAELPGVKEDDVDVRLEGDTLIIKGEKKEESEDKDGNYYRSECRYGSFTRAIPLNAEVDAENVEATFKNGVLRVKLPKLSEEKTSGKRIQVTHE